MTETSRKRVRSLVDLPEEILVHIFSYLYEPWHLIIRPRPAAFNRDIFTFELSRNLSLTTALICRSMHALTRQAVGNAFIKALFVSCTGMPIKCSYIVSHKSWLSQVTTVHFMDVISIWCMGRNLLENLQSVRTVICGPSAVLRATIREEIKDDAHSPTDAASVTKELWLSLGRRAPWFVSMVQSRNLKLLQKLSGDNGESLYVSDE